MKKRIFKLILIVTLFYVPSKSMAWGMLGHRIVGQIAESYLTDKARLQIKQILGNESMAMASNWPDFIKSDKAYSYLSPWHYVDFDKQYSYPEMQQYLQRDTATDAYTKLNFLVAELKKKNLPQDKKVMYLRLVIHIVGDIHQPMHTGHTEDKGGNDIKVTWFGQPSNLHSVWDSGLIEYQQLSYTEYVKAINFPTQLQLKEWKKVNVSKWLYDSSLEADKIYKGVKDGDKLSYRYNFDYVETLNRQLLKGGVHLAAILNQIFA
ncbi:S1/P1 nuclease [Hufsiella arboris]|nr:S1/P1 nuclease [Hufsiella arboris]